VISSSFLFASSRRVVLAIMFAATASSAVSLDDQNADSIGILTSEPQTFDWRDTVRLEHADRRARFERLAAEGLIQTPLFYEALISGHDLPQFGTDIPVLRIVFPQRVYFDTDRTVIRPEAERVLDLIAENLRRDAPDVALFIAGHADARGSDEYNYLLSVARADAVARALFSRGTGLTRLWRIGFGEAVPVAPNTTLQNMAENRRVEFLFAAKAEAVAVLLLRQATTLCAEAEPEVAATCRERVALLPPLVAEPVLNEEQVEVAATESSEELSTGEGLGSIEIDRTLTTVFAQETEGEIPVPGEERTEVEIGVL
jgi:outer membrane protein OmpA-like peptidoglycan-associated protein